MGRLLLEDRGTETKVKGTVTEKDRWGGPEDLKGMDLWEVKQSNKCLE